MPLSGNDAPQHLTTLKAKDWPDKEGLRDDVNAGNARNETSH